MSFLKIDHEKAQQGRYMPPEGQYECLITMAKYNMTRNGTEYLHISLLIRDDVEQEGMGEVIDWSVWRKRKPGRQDPDGFAAGTIQHISKVVGFENGMEFSTIDDWMRALKGRTVRVEIKHEEYNDRVSAKVAYSYPSEHPNLGPAIPQGFVEVDDADDPF